LDPSDSYFLFADFVDFYTHWTYILYMPIFSRIFFTNYWWQRSNIWSQASYRYPILWEAFFDSSDSYFLFAEEGRNLIFGHKLHIGTPYRHLFVQFAHVTDLYQTNPNFFDINFLWRFLARFSKFIPLYILQTESPDS
jgi:hypothetical protein